MKKFHVFSAMLALAAFAMLAGPALAGNVVPVGSLLFEDNFSYPGEIIDGTLVSVNGDLNVNITSASRVSGPLAGLVSYDTANMAGAKDIDGLVPKLDLSTGGDPSYAGRVGLSMDFNNSLALGGFTVVANVIPRGTYAGIGVGHNGSSAANIGDLLAGNWADVAGLYSNVFAAGTGLSVTSFASDGAAQPAQPSDIWFNYLGFGAGYSDFVELALVCTDTDNNPFDGSGTITVQEYVNGDLVATATGPDFAHNFLSFQMGGDSYVSYQDLRVYGNAAAVPEPGALALLAAAAGFAFVWFRRR
jgi:hypothetical protein